MPDHAPRVAVPARLSADDARDPRVSGANRIFHDVVALVRANGLDPVVVDHVTDLAGYAGVVLPGGGDIDPALYGGEHCDALYDVNPEQDALDLTFARSALETATPVLGICRGAQVLNVAAGGTLHADLAPSTVAHSHTPAQGEPLTFAWHPVAIVPSRLRDAIGADSISVASGHHQGIATLGASLRPTALAGDGLVEAFEDERGTAFGVQWHPEAEGTPRSDQDAPFLLLAAAIAERQAAHV